jgi:asparagine synthase (glutamine-hydrolysing)
MCNEDGTIWISYNGELYDFQEHRERLLAKGHRFRSQSDTEVLIHLYEELGPDLLQEVNGIFAFALWDGGRRQLLLARDHAGVKPLYYWQQGPRLYFASEIKALLEVPDIPRELDRDAIPDYLTFLWVPGRDTLLKGIHKLEPGHHLIWKEGHVELGQWFWLPYEPDTSVGESEWVERVHDTFTRTTRRQMVSDVPLGAYLSGGADSSSIAACMRSSFPERKIKCYTVRFDPQDMVREQFEDDYPYAKRVAEHLDVELESFLMRSDSIRLLPKMVYHLDEPDADPAVFPSYWISKLAHDDGTTVLLSGTGGDEIFFGYRSHQAYGLYEHLGRVPRALAAPALAGADILFSAFLRAQSRLARRLRRFRRGLPEHGLERHMELADWSTRPVRHQIYAPELTSFLEGRDPIPACMYKYFDSFRGQGDLNCHSHLLIQTFLSAHNFLYTDKSSMATSVEVRVPFMDVELMRLGARIPEDYKLRGGVTKYILKKAMERHLPSSVLHRSKVGFGAPLRKWVAEDLDEVIDEALGPRQIEARGLFDPRAIRAIVQENRENKADHTYLIYALLNLELWMPTFLDRPGEELSF